MPTAKFDRDLLMQGFSLGDWTVMPDRGLLLLDPDIETHLEPKVMDVLLELAAHQGQVVSRDQFESNVWQYPVSDDPIIRCIAALRKAFDDDVRAPRFIETVAKRGYRLLVPVTIEAPQAAEEAPQPAADVETVEAVPHRPRWPYYLPLAAGFAAIGVILIMAINPAGGPLRSLAVYQPECAADDMMLCYGFSYEVVGALLETPGTPAVVRVQEPLSKQASDGCEVEGLTVDSVLHGSVVRSGDRLNVSMEIRNCETGFMEWTERFDGGIAEAAPMRTAVARAVVRHWVNAEAAQDEGEPEPLPFAVQDLYIQAHYELASRSSASIRRSIELFRETTLRAPNFGPAHVWLGYAYMLLPEYSNEPRNRMYELAEQSARRGVAIDPRMRGLGNTIDGFIRHKRGQWSSANRAHLEAINADIVYPESHQLYSRLLASVGLLEDALQEAQRAREKDPKQAVFISRLAIAYFWLDDLDNAGQFFLRSDMHKEYEAAVHDLAYALYFIRQGDYDNATREAMLGLEKYGLESGWVPAVFAGLGDESRYDEAHGIVEALANSGQLTPTVEITLWVLLYDQERAMQVARRLRDSGEIFEAELMFAPQFKVLREHPDFPQLLDDIGLTDHWNSIGCEWRDDRVRCEESQI